MKTNVYGDVAIEFMKKDKNLDLITRGDLDLMHDIYERAVELGAKPLKEEQSQCFYAHARVLNGLDRDERFKKTYINYPGIINRPTRCFSLIDSSFLNKSSKEKKQCAS